MLPKVSMISPCYNGSTYLKRFLDSLLVQNYKNVEFIFINDGSTDNTEEIFMSHKQLLEAKGWSIIYIKQENKGQASAINEALKIFTGDYVFFPDADDIMYPEHIAEKVKFMEKNPDVALVYCPIDVVDEQHIDVIINTFDNCKSSFLPLTTRLLTEKLDIWGSISNMYRAKNLIDANPSLKIYEGKGGQNFQLLFPIACKYKEGYIKKTLGKYVIRRTSHSRLQKTVQERNAELFDIWINTILSLDDTNKNKALYINKSYTHFTSPQYIDFNKKIFLFDLIPLIKIKRKNDKIKIYFLGIHLFTIKD